MTVELVLLLSIFATITLGVFLGDIGPIQTFKKATPRLAARVERNITVGYGFRQAKDGRGVSWDPPQGSQ
jgi:hypothetical protein